MRFCSIVLMLCTVAHAGADEPADLRTRRDGSDWTGFLGPTGDGISTEKGIIAPWPKEGLKVVWHLKLGEGYSPIVTSRGRLLVFDRHANQNRLTCRNAETGAEIWRYEYPTDYEDYFGYSGGPRCSPVVDGDRVYIYGAEGELHCVRVTDGKGLWKRNMLVEYQVLQNFFGNGSPPIVEGDLLLVPAGGSPQGTRAGLDDFLDRKANGTAIVALDKVTGAEKYKTGDELASYAAPVVKTINGRRLGLYFARGGLIGFEPATGRVDFHYRWRSRLLESVNASNPVVVGDRVLLTECYGPGTAVVKLKPGEAETIWTDDPNERRKSLQCHWNTPIHHNGQIYGCSGRHTAGAELRCIDLVDGKVRWRRPGFSRSSLLMIDGHFVAMCEDGLLLLLKVNPDKYEEVSRWDLSDSIGDKPGLLQYPCWPAPIVSHGLMYLRGKDSLVCVELIPKR